MKANRIGNSSLVGFMCFAALLGCGHGPNIHVIVPTDFRGPVKIVELPAAPEMTVEEGNYKINVADDGIAQVRSLEPFGKWHATKVFTADGKELNDAEQIEEIPGEVQWWSLGRQAGGGPGDSPASVDLFIGTPDEYMAYKIGLEDRDQIIDRISNITNPADCFGRSENPCHKMFEELELIAKLDTSELEALYSYFDERRSQTQSDRIDNLLALLTRIAFEVESIKERKRFSNWLDDGARPNDWLYPLAISDGKFVLLGEGFRDHSTGWRSGPKAEFDYVVKRVARRP